MFFRLKSKKLEKEIISTSLLEKKENIKIWEHPLSKKKSKVPLLVILHPYGFGPEILYNYFLKDTPTLLEHFSILGPKGTYKASHFANPIFYPKVWGMIDQSNIYSRPPSWFDLKIDFYQTILKRSLSIKLTNTLQAIQSVNEISDQIKKVLNKSPYLDKENVSLFGYSQGAMLALYLSLTFPEKFKNILVMSGKSHEYLFDIEKKPPQAYSHLNFLICNKIQDKIMPIKEAQEIPTLLEHFGIPKNAYQFNIYKGKHFINKKDKYYIREYLKKII